MDVHDFYYDLPQELIAQTPLADRSASRLLVLDRKTGAVEHRHFTDIAAYLEPGDCLVLNDTRVIPARLLGVKEPTHSPIEFVLLRRVPGDGADGDGADGAEAESPDCCFWEVMVRPGRRARPGTFFTFGDGLLRAEVLRVVEGGNRIVRFRFHGAFEEILERIGLMPLPPYIKEKLRDPERYQTVYARENGSAAAPTAGLHFTQALLDSLRAKGVRVAFVTLHVGLGTFRPVKETQVEAHVMHTERYEITEATCDAINTARREGHRIVAVGTTSCRVLESVAREDGTVAPARGETDIFMYPGYRVKVTDRLITNFHLPESTLLMLVSALAGRERILAAYREAIAARYRFFSFGDAMLIL